MKPFVCFLVLLVLNSVVRPLRAADTESEYPEIRRSFENVFAPLENTSV